MSRNATGALWAYVRGLERRLIDRGLLEPLEPVHVAGHEVPIAESGEVGEADRSSSGHARRPHRLA